METRSTIEQVRHYYSEKVKQHGPTPQGVDWRDEASQLARFDQLAFLLEDEHCASLADIGCGYGALAPFLRARGWTGAYEGVDLSEAMIEAARHHLRDDPRFKLTVGQVPTQPADFVVASGIFNVRGNTEESVWKEYVFDTIDQMVRSARKGVGFNCLTSWSDVPHMRPDLYYAVPEQIFHYCAANHSRWLELSQDYGLFEFTVRMRLDRKLARKQETGG